MLIINPRRVELYLQCCPAGITLSAKLLRPNLDSHGEALRKATLVDFNLYPSSMSNQMNAFAYAFLDISPEKILTMSQTELCNQDSILHCKK